MTYPFKGRTAMVTGAAIGIGRAIALRLAREGCNLALFDRSEQELAETARDAAALGVKVNHVVGSVTDRDAVAALVGQSLAAHQRIDFLVNNAGIGNIASILDVTEQEFDDTIQVNMWGNFHLCKAVVPHMIAARFGGIVNVSSWFGKSGRPQSYAYCATKFALIGMTQSMAIDLARHGIRVNAVCPGTIDHTAMREQADREAVARGLPTAAERAHLIPLGRLGEPDDIAKGVAFLLSDEADYMTGQAINLTGGLWMN